MSYSQKIHSLFNNHVLSLMQWGSVVSYETNSVGRNNKTYQSNITFLARLDEVQEELLYYPPASVLALASALAAAAALLKC